MLGPETGCVLSLASLQATIARVRICRFAGLPRSPQPKPAGRPGDLPEDPQSDAFKVVQRAPSCPCAIDHGIRNALAYFVTVLVRWNLLADGIERRRHVRDRCLIKLQHVSLTMACDWARLRWHHISRRSERPWVLEIDHWPALSGRNKAHV